MMMMMMLMGRVRYGWRSTSHVPDGSVLRFGES